MKLLIKNGVSISEAFSRTGYNISNSRKLQFCKKPFEIIQEQIAFKTTVQCVNKQTVAPCVLACRAGVFWREPRALTPPSWIRTGPFPERGISFRTNSRTGYTKIGLFLERGITFRGFFLERGANLESRAARPHPKNTQVLPPAPGLWGHELASSFRLFRLQSSNEFMPPQKQICTSER